MYQHYANHYTLYATWEREEQQKQKEEKEQIKTNSKTIPVSPDVLEYEIVPQIALIDLISYCETNHASRNFCEDRKLIETRVVTLAYEELTEQIVLWFRKGLKLSMALKLMPSIVNRVDLYTLQLCYYILVEQKRSDDAKALQEIVGRSTNHAKTIKDELWLKTEDRHYEPLRRLLRVIKQIVYSRHDAHDVLTIFNNAMESMRCCATSSINMKYQSHLLVDQLGDEELLRLVMALLIGNNRHTGVNNHAMLHLAAAVHQRKRLTPPLSLAIGSSLNHNQIVEIFSPSTLGYTPGRYNEYTTQPLNRESVVELLEAGRLTATLPCYLRPSEVIVIAQERRLVLANLIPMLRKWRAYYTSCGYGMWIETTINQCERCTAKETT